LLDLGDALNDPVVSSETLVENKLAGNSQRHAAQAAILIPG
jgi:hypothetical protein